MNPNTGHRNRGWKRAGSTPSLSEVHSSINIPKNIGSFRKFLAFTGPGLLVAVGYMDPGNWATDITGGSKYGYSLLFVILLSNLFAILLQFLSLKLGIVAERDLAQACRDTYSKPVNFVLWILTEIAIAATDLAEVIGAAIALNLLFGIPLFWGIGITVIDVMLILALQAKGFRYIESIVGALILTILGCFIYEIVVSQPNIKELFGGFIPQKKIVTDYGMLYIAVGILGATVMPHNLYLHSSIVQTRNYDRTTEGKREAIKYAGLDSSIALMLAFFINASILITAAAAFHHSGMYEVAEIQDAYKLLAPVLGTSLASILFAVALLASGQNSTLTGTLAGQIVMEGFMNIRLKPWIRRLITRLLAVIPAIIVIWITGEQGANDLLILSQVTLSLQLSFAVVPLIIFTGSKAKMGEFANSRLTHYTAWVVAGIIIVLNVFLISETLF